MRTRGGGERKWEAEGAAGGGVSGDGASSDRAGLWGAWEGAVLELRDVVWAEPLVVEKQGCEVNIALQAEEDGNRV